MRALHPLLKQRLQRDDVDARLIVKAVQEEAVALRHTYEDWINSDAYTGYLGLNRGGVVLSGADADAVAQATDGAYIEDLDNDTPFQVAYVIWDQDEEDVTVRELHKLTAKLVAQRDGGEPKEVAWWRAQLFRTSAVAAGSVWTLEPISDVIEVEATGTTTPTTVTFPLTDVTVHIPAGPGDPPFPDSDSYEAPVTVVMIWALDANGNGAGNVGWATETSNTQLASGDHIVGRMSLAAVTGRIAHNGRTECVASSTTGVPVFTLGGKTYSGSATVTFSGAKALDLGAVPTFDVEVVAEGLTPSDSSLVFEINDGGGWVECFDGDLVGADNTDTGGADLSGVAVQQTYAMRVTLAPNTNGTISPTATRMGVRAVDVQELDRITVVHDPRWYVNPDTFKGEISECVIEVIRDGARDYRDWATELLSTKFLEQTLFRIYIGADDLDRRAWLHIDDFYIEDYDPDRASIRFLCLSALHKVRQVLPVYDTAANKRAALAYSSQTLKDVYDDLMTGQAESLPPRVIGPGVMDDTTTISKRIFDSDLKDEVDAVAYIAGGGLTTSRGQIVFKDLSTRNASRYTFGREEIRWHSTGPGLRKRVPQYFVPYQWLYEENRYGGEIRSYHSNALLNLGMARIDTNQVLNDVVAQWIDSQALAEAVARRKTLAQGSGLLEWEFSSIYPHPELEVGDTVVVNTERFVAKDVNTERAIRGEVWALGVITGVVGAWGTRFRIWIRGLDDIVPSEVNSTRRTANPRIDGLRVVWVPGPDYWTAELHYDLKNTQSLKINPTWVQTNDDPPPPSTTFDYEYEENLSGQGVTTIKQCGDPECTFLESVQFVREQVGDLVVTIVPYSEPDAEGISGDSKQVIAEDVNETGAVGVRLEDSVAGVTLAGDKGIVGAGLVADVDGNGRPRISLSYTASESDPTGTPDDGDLWFKYEA